MSNELVRAVAASVMAEEVVLAPTEEEVLTASHIVAKARYRQEPTDANKDAKRETGRKLQEFRWKARGGERIASAMETLEAEIDQTVEEFKEWRASKEGCA